MGKGNIGIRRDSDLSSGGKPISPKTEIAQTGPKTKVIVKIFDAVITMSLFFIFFGFPLFFISLTYQGIIFEKQIYFYFWLLLALVAWAAKGVITGELKIRRTPLDIPIIIFWLLYLLSTIFSVDRWHSFWGFFGDPSRGLMSITALIIAYYLIFSHFTAKRMKFMTGGFVAAGIILSLWMTLGILGVKFLPAKLMALSPLSLIGSVSGAGAVFSLMIPLFITVVFLVRSSENLGKALKNVLTGLLLAGLALDIFLILALYNFVPWIGLLIGLGLFLIYILSRLVRPVESWTWLPMALFVVIMAILMIGAVNISRVNLPVEVSPSYGISAEVAKNAIKNKFVLGSGPATYGYDFSLQRPQNFNQNYFYNLRFYQGTGIVAETVATLGALGSIALAVMLLSFLSVGVYLLTREKEKNKVYSLGLFAAMLILLIYSVTSRAEGTILIIGSLLGTLTLATLLWESNSEEKYLNLTLKASPKYALALAFVFMVVTAGVAYLFVFVGKTFVADVYAGMATREQQISEEGSVSKLIKAISLYNKEGRYFTRAGQEYMVLANNEMLKGEKERDLSAIQKYLNNSIAAAVRGRDLMKNDVLAAEILAQVYENAGFYVKDSLTLAEEAYKQAQNLEPHNPNYFVKLGQIKISLAAAGKDENEKKQLVGEAKDLFQKSINEKNNLAAGLYQLALAKEALGEIDGAIDDMKQAFILERGNITYAFNLGRLFQVRGEDEDNKVAEDLFKQILGINDKEINTHFSLGLLYEKTNRKSDAVSEYQKVLDLLPASPAGGPAESEDARTRIQKMIDNIQSGISNFAQNVSGSNEDQVPMQPAEQPMEQPTEQPAE